jgi:hypothetical protein
VHANFFKSKTDKGANVSTLLAALRGRSVVNGLSRALGVGVILAGGALMTSCHSNVTEGRSPVYVIMDVLEGGSAKGSGTPTFSTVLQSDVVTKGSIFEDPGRVTMHLELKDITQGNAPTSNNLVTINHYRVVFRRTDGRNVQGVDVPYAFEGAATFTVSDVNTTAGFVLVRAQAKLEAPLIQLAGGGGSLLISTIADVTFYGKDATGTEVAVTGSISVNFADWGDPAGS